MKIQTEPTCHKWYPQIGTVTVSAPSRGMSSKMYLNHANFGGTKPSEKSTKMKLLNLLTKKSHINTYHKSSQISRITYHLLFLLLHPSIHPSILDHPSSLASKLPNLGCRSSVSQSSRPVTQVAGTNASYEMVGSAFWSYQAPTTFDI